jgi:hypothetical protein
LRTPHGIDDTAMAAGPDHDQPASCNMKCGAEFVLGIVNDEGLVSLRRVEQPSIAVLAGEHSGLRRCLARVVADDAGS